MANEEILSGISMKAKVDLSSSQYLFVKVSGDMEVDLAGDGENAIGVLQDKPVLGDYGNVGVMGVSKVVASAIIAAGAKVASTAAGKAVTAVATKHVLGQALEAAAADGEIISVLLLAKPILV